MPKHYTQPLEQVSRTCDDRLGQQALDFDIYVIHTHIYQMELDVAHDCNHMCMY